MYIEKEAIEGILKHIKVKNFYLYLYGSSAYNILAGRDIDSVVISPDYENVRYIQFDINIKQNQRTCNLYLVPNQTYFDDVYTLKYGGYYSHKFAFSFNEIFREGNSVDAPFSFWKNEYRLYRETGEKCPDAETLIKYVHYNIMKYQPHFGYPLTKFISDDERRKKLSDYVKYNILNINLNSDYYLPESFDKDLNENKEKMFYNYWIEYNKYKDKTSFWSKKTFLKIKKSYDNLDYPLIKQYFNLL